MGVNESKVRAELKKMFGDVEFTKLMRANNKDFTLEANLFITPEIASRVIAYNYSKNRDIKKSHVKYLSYEFQKDFQYTGVPISMTFDPVILNGQHTLLAVAQSGITAELRISVGIPIEAYPKLDNNNQKKPHERMRVADDAEANQVAVKTIQWLKKNVLKDMVSAKMTDFDAQAFMNKNRAAVNNVCRDFLGKTANGMSRAYIMAAILQYYISAPAKAKEFSRLLRSRCSELPPAQFNEKHPIVQLYQELVTNVNVGTNKELKFLKNIYWVMNLHYNGNLNPVNKLEKQNTFNLNGEENEV